MNEEQRTEIALMDTMVLLVKRIIGLHAQIAFLKEELENAKQGAKAELIAEKMKNAQR